MERICCSLELNVMKKTMAAASAAGLLLCLFISVTAAADCQKYVATGDSYTLKLLYTIKPGNIIKWFHNSVTYVEVKDDKERCCHGSKKDLMSDGSLKLNNIRKDQGGNYTPQVFDSNGRRVSGLKSTILCVLDRVPKPIVNFTCNNKLKVALQCVVREATKDGYHYKWFHDGKEVAKQTKQTYSGNIVEGKFHCVIYNQASQQESDIVTSPCAASGFVFPDMLWGISIWIFVGAGGGVWFIFGLFVLLIFTFIMQQSDFSFDTILGIALLLIMLIICCCICNRRRKQMRIKDEAEFRLHFTPPSQEQPQQQQHHQHHHHSNQQQRQPPGHTGPRHHRPKGPNGARGTDLPGSQPWPSPRKPAQGPGRVGNDEEAPPLPQPRKKMPKGQRA